ncbi:MAG: class I SAM-dependent methyltransferase [Candidatus Methanomethylophilaceae archaeon]
MSDVHPFDGERKGYDEKLRFWDDYADVYSSMQQGDIPVRIVDRLMELGMLESTDEVLEIGSGPGTYSLVMAPRVAALTCMDTSPRMLERLSSGASSRGIGNISCVLQDWNAYVPDMGFDACIATLCPGSGTPESISRMEATARRSCILVSWITNHGDDLGSEIWKRMGKDYGYDFRKSTEVQDRLRDSGRDPHVEFFKTRIETDIPISALIAKEESAFRAHGVDADIASIVRDIVGPELDGDILHYSAENEMKLICWNPKRV